jgi:hypothetical protein
MAVQLQSKLERAAKYFEGAMECVVPWKFPLLLQYSVKSSVVLERSYKLVIKYNQIFGMYRLVM